MIALGFINRVSGGVFGGFKLGLIALVLFSIIFKLNNWFEFIEKKTINESFFKTVVDKTSFEKFIGFDIKKQIQKETLKLEKEVQKQVLNLENEVEGQAKDLENKIKNKVKRRGCQFTE